MYPLSQVLFLIDTKCFHTFHRQFHDDLYVLRLACLRLLTHFAHISQSRKSLKWGYKFYDSSNLHRRSAQQKNFKEFSADEFELFEKVLVSHHEQEKELLSKNGAAINNSARNKKSPKGHLAVGFNKMLKDTLLDFQWDRPDISSPVRSRKRGGKCLHVCNGSEENENVRHNFVFVVTSCPHDDKEMLMFFGPEYPCSNKDGRIFSGLLSDRVFSGFLEMHRIHLCCLDTHPAPTEQCNDSNRLSAVYIPIQSLASSHVPFSSIFSWYFQVPSSCDNVMQNVMLVHEDLKMNEEVYCNLHLIPFNKDSHRRLDNEKLLIRGLTENTSHVFENSISYAVFPVDNAHTFLYIIQMLKRNKQAMIVTLDNKLGFLKPLSSVAATLNVTEIKSSEKLDQLKRLDANALQRTDVDDGSFEIKGIVQPVVDAVLDKMLEECHDDSRFSNELSTATSSSTRNGNISIHLLESWCIPQPLELTDCIDEYQSMMEEENDMLHCLRSHTPSNTKEINGDGIEELSQPTEDLESEDVADNNEGSLSKFNIAFSSKEEMISSLVTYYHENVENSSSLTTCAENIIKAVMKNDFDGVQVEELLSLLEKEVFTSVQEIGEKYRENSEEANRHRMHEFELQALLRFNVMNQLPAHSQLNIYCSQVIEHLQKLMIYVNPSGHRYVHHFLNETVLKRYSDIPESTIKEVYDELFITFPNDKSDEDDDNIGVTNDKTNFVSTQALLSNASSQLDNLPSVEEVVKSSSQVPARKLLRPASFSGITHRRQIAIPKTKKPKIGTKQNKNSLPKSGSHLVDAAPNKGGVCRNLLTKFSCTTSPGKRSLKRKRVLKTKSVNETPVKKQVANAAVHRQIRHRDKTMSVDTSFVIEETPEKSCNNNLNTSPVFKKFKATKVVKPLHFDTSEADENPPSPEVLDIPNIPENFSPDRNVISPELLPEIPECSSSHNIVLKRRHSSWPQTKSKTSETFITCTDVTTTTRTFMKRLGSEPMLADGVIDNCDDVCQVPSTPLDQGEPSPSPIALEVPFAIEIGESNHVNSNNTYSDDSNCSFELSESMVPSPEIKMINCSQVAISTSANTNNHDINQIPKKCQGTESLPQSCNSVEVTKPINDPNVEVTANDAINNIAPFSDDISTTKSDHKQANTSAITNCSTEDPGRVNQQTTPSPNSISTNNHNYLNHDHTPHCTSNNANSPSSASLLHLASSPVLYIHTPKRASGHWKKRKL